jgi:AcrR family transcriptional regulator
VSPGVRVARERRDAIVRATIRCLARVGYGGLTMKRVAAEAALVPGILHYYFRDKREILAEAAERVTRDLDRRVGAEARGTRDAWGRLRALVRACLATALDEREVWTVFIAFWGEALHDTELAAVNARAYARSRRLIAAGIARGTAEGAFRPVDPLEAGTAILAILDGLSLQLTFDSGGSGDFGKDSPRRRLERVARLADEVLVRYLTPRPLEERAHESRPGRSPTR